MSIHIHATYRNGVIHPRHPLELPDDTPLEIAVTPLSGEVRDVAETGSPVVRPPAPRITAQRLQEIIERHAVSIGTLPRDFSREDIYQDHD